MKFSFEFSQKVHLCPKGRFSKIRSHIRNMGNTGNMSITGNMDNTSNRGNTGNMGNAGNNG